MAKKDNKQPPSMFDNMDLFEGVNFDKELQASAAENEEAPAQQAEETAKKKDASAKAESKKGAKPVIELSGLTFLNISSASGTILARAPPLTGSMMTMGIFLALRIS